MKALLGGILLAIGILIAGLSGLCSLAFFVMGLTNSDGGAGELPIIFIVGGIPFLVGIGLLLGGRALLKSSQSIPPPPAPPGDG